MKIVIIGLGTIGRTILKDLSGMGHRITIIDENKDKIDNLIGRYDVSAVVGNGACLDIQKEANIEDAKILVSCGRGVKNLASAHELAGKIKGTVSSSRTLVDLGLVEHARQVGQTGKTVRPEAYLAFGISGAIQHLAGMEESEFIVAVNTDKNAPIFKVANLGIVADAEAVFKNLNKML